MAEDLVQDLDDPLLANHSKPEDLEFDEVEEVDQVDLVQTFDVHARLIRDRAAARASQLHQLRAELLLSFLHDLDPKCLHLILLPWSGD